MKKVNKLQVLSVFLFSIIFTLFTSSAFAGQWIVKKDDNLSKIAADYPGVTAGEICKANTFMFKVKGCNHIEPGWLLVIPKVGDCFDATMLVASKQKIRNEWNRKVVSDYKDGKPDCNFKELSNKKVRVIKPVVINFLSDTSDGDFNSKMKIFTFVTLGSSDVIGVGGFIKSPSDYVLSYQFSGSSNLYSNQVLFGKYLTKDLAIVSGPRFENNSGNNSDLAGVKISILYTPKIINSFFGYVEIGISTMKVKEYQKDGVSKLALNGSILSISTPIIRKENNYWKRNFNVSFGVAYKF